MIGILFLMAGIVACAFIDQPETGVSICLLMCAIGIGLEMLIQMKAGDE